MIDLKTKPAKAGDGIVIEYDKSKVLMDIIEKGANRVNEVKIIMIQNTTSQDAYKALERVSIDEKVRPAHFIVDDKRVVKYAPSSASVLTPQEQYTESAHHMTEDKPKLTESILDILLKPKEEDAVVYKDKDLKCPGDYITVVDMCINDNPEEVELNLINFLCFYLKKHNLTTANIWRAGDLVKNFVTPRRYKDSDDWSNFLAVIDNCIKNDEPAKNILVTPCCDIKCSVCIGKHCKENCKICNSSCVEKCTDPEHDASCSQICTTYWLPDKRPFKYISKSTLTNTAPMVEEDYVVKTIGSSVFKKSRFEDEEVGSEFVQLQNNLYEPVYPDLTIPPRSATSLYNQGIYDYREIIRKLEEKEQTENTDIKPVIGKIPNFFDPYPIDEKIAQLEKHSPMVTLEYESASQIASDLTYYVVNRAINTEKRLVALENILASQMRILNRLSSRININCVYYGGQSVFGKYNCIRCLSDDLVNDAAQVTLDQCLNCSRYEPIEGQVYEIMSEQANPGKANIYDDIQASYMTKQDFVELNRIEIENVEDDRPNVDLTTTHMRDEEDLAYDILLADASNFVMDWSNVPLEKQSPHVNLYSYDFTNIGLDKDRLKPENKYEDGWKDVEQRKYQRPDYGVNALGGGGFGGDVFGMSTTGSSYALEDYDLTEDDLRYKIKDIAERAIALGEQKAFQYTFGAKIVDPSKTPEDLVIMAKNGEEVSTGKTPEDIEPAVYTDCSNFTHYVYYCASGGKLDIPGTTAELEKADTSFKFLGIGKTTLEAIKEAIPGDLILYRGKNGSGHVSIYAGHDEAFEAYGDNNVDLTKQVIKSKIKDRSDFFAILRHNDLSEPKLKNIQYVDLDITLNEYVRKYQCVAKKNTLDGQDNNYTQNYETIIKYADPNIRMDEEKKLQFMTIENCFPDGLVTAEMIDAFLKHKKKTKYMPTGAAFVEAGKRSNINPLWLVIHTAQETGWCERSSWMNEQSDRYFDSQGRRVYNPFGLWCYNSDPDRKAAIQNCSERGWFDKDTALIGGSEYLAKTYLSDEAVKKHGLRNTTYFMKWTPGSTIKGYNGTPGGMYYSSDISWCDQRAKMFKEIVDICSRNNQDLRKHIRYLIPRYKQ